METTTTTKKILKESKYVDAFTSSTNHNLIKSNDSN